VKTPNARAVVFQDARLLPWKKVWRNVALGLKGADIRVRAEAALKEVGLGHRLDAWPATLSGRRAQRTALARALVREPACCCWTSPSRRWTP
jgi:sulfonate transport system ATP-binding protein